MPTCVDRLLGMLLFCVLTMLPGVTVSSQPYAQVTEPLGLGKVPGVPVYYLVGDSGVPGPGNQGHTSNAGFVVTNEGVVVFDTLGTPALGYAMIEAIRGITDLPISHVVVSHYHADHVYGLEAFVDHAGQPLIIAQAKTAGYRSGDAASQGEDAKRRLEQRRQVLFPWVTERTRIVSPDTLFDDEFSFEVGGITFEVRHPGPAHAPGDSVMLVRDYGVLFSGDIVYKNRVPYLDSPHTDVFRWLEELDQIVAEAGKLDFLVPGHGKPSADIAGSVVMTRDYIRYLVEQLQPAVDDFVPFDQAYAQIDWSRYSDLPAFAASNRGNAYRVYLELEARSF